LQLQLGKPIFLDGERQAEKNPNKDLNSLEGSLNPGYKGHQERGNGIMCLAIPARVVKIRNDTALIDMEGTKREVSLLLLPETRIGDYVIVHAGFAIHGIDETEAMASLKALREMAALAEEEIP
jgi:hydrogenase expression/formation protein HypC